MKTLDAIFLQVATVAVAFSLTAGFRTQAATITWTNTASGSWNTATNWNPNSVPGTNDTAVITLTNAGVTVSLAAASGAGAIILGTNAGGPVTLALAGQTLTLNGPLTVNPSGAFTVNSGTLSGYTNAVLSGTIGWTAGSLAGTFTIATKSTLTLAGGGNNLNFPNCTLTNYGTVAWTNGYPDGGGSPGTLIYNYGLWDCQSDYNLKSDSGGNGVVFNNYGTLRKSAGTNASGTVFPGGVVLNQLAGKLDLQQGNFYLESGGNFTGGTATNNNGALYLYGGNFTLNGTPTGTNVIENAGNLVGVVVINGGLNWVNGNWNGASNVAILANSTVLMAGGVNNLGMNNCTLTNNGTVVWSSGYPDGGGTTPGTLIYNYGLWDCQSDYTFKADAGGNGVVFNNYGTLRKSVGTNTSETFFNGGVVLNQLPANWICSRAISTWMAAVILPEARRRIITVRCIFTPAISLSTARRSAPT